MNIIFIYISKVFMKLITLLCVNNNVKLYYYYIRTFISKYIILILIYSTKRMSFGLFHKFLQVVLLPANN